MKLHWKILGNIWALPLTLIGLIFALFGWTRFYRFEKEDWSWHFISKGGITGWFFTRYAMAGYTVGSIIVYVNQRYADRQLTVMHERAHVRQCYKGGILAIPLYYLASLIAWVAGQDKYRGNDFEEQARVEAGQEDLQDSIKPKEKK